MANVLANVGKRLREIRKSKGYSQESLAEKCGFTFSYIGGIERAEKNVSLINLEKVADALEVELYELFVYTSDLNMLAEKENELKALMQLLMYKTPKEIKKARILLKGIYEED
jgi:transcriptional regulator with XRE-family HTH domain